MQDARANAVGEYLSVGGGVIHNKLVNQYSLDRFILAQEKCYEDVLNELIIFNQATSIIRCSDICPLDSNINLNSFGFISL